MISKSDAVFAGSVPELYDTYLVPLIFEPYAADLAKRLRAQPTRRVLEIACGTGVVTRAVAASMERSVEIVATDLNVAMLERARSIDIARPVEWRQADAMKLPFDDGSFDAVLCQFGAMFFPDKAKAFAEARRVLEPGGVFLFNVWDRIEENHLAHVVTNALAAYFPANPPRFLARTPHGYADRDVIRRDVVDAGFAAPQLETLAEWSRAATAEQPAIAYCQGTPLRDEILRLDDTALTAATHAAATAVAARFGAGPIEAKMQAHVVTARR
jgi:ubiquinone/menaquinone biosynthesis C-methylase UbiE